MIGSGRVAVVVVLLVETSSRRVDPLVALVGIGVVGVGIAVGAGIEMGGRGIATDKGKGVGFEAEGEKDRAAQVGFYPCRCPP